MKLLCRSLPALCLLLASCEDVPLLYNGEIKIVAEGRITDTNGQPLQNIPVVIL